jgi:GNAT superfamily N-acetyltransferase
MQMPLSIRHILPEYAHDIERIYAQSAAHLRSIGDTGDLLFNSDIYLRDGFGNRRAFEGIVAIQNARVVGYLLYFLGYDSDAASRYLFVVDLAVEESQRRSGIGKALMAEAEKIARKEGAGKIALWVHEKNESAIQFYHELGAQEESPELRYMTLKLPVS